MLEEDDQLTNAEPAADLTRGTNEASMADLVEQATPANPSDLQYPRHTAFEANEYDAIEQSLSVGFDDEAY